MKIGAISLVIAAATLTFVQPSAAQPFTQVIVFGDSNVDSGFYKVLPNPGGNATFNADWAPAVAHGAGAPTTSPNLMNSQMLASSFGLTANPSNAVGGGTNFATSGAKNKTVNSSQTGGFTQAIPTVTQIANYLSAHGGVADSQALYFIYSGDNDVSYANGDSGAGPYPPDPTAYVTQAANDLVTAIGTLKSAGAQKILVSLLAYDYPTGSGNAAKRALKLAYSNAIRSGLASLGGSFYIGDIDTVRLAISANPGKYGFTNIGTGSGQMACTQPSGVTTAWALLCSSDAAAPSTWVSATAPQTDLFADDQHLGTAGQRYMAKYLRSLVVSPPATHDFNFDRKSDILWREAGGTVAMWLMNGGTVSSNLLVSSVPTTWSIQGQRDFNGDAKADILWHDTSGNVAIWLMNGGTVSSSTFIANVPTAWSIAGTGDFNSDGKADILWRDNTGNVAIWLMNGTTVSSSIFVANVPLAWTIAASAGNNIFWRDNTGNVAMWQMNGGQVSSNTLIANVPASWSLVGAGDFDGDGFTDILWRDNTGNVAVWLMGANAQVVSSVFVANVPNTWSIADTGDYNGDGKSDILWRDNTGNVAIWLMNGGTVSSNLFVSNVPTNWTIQGHGQ